jgi:cytochrome c peroxidase/DNA-binding beta-propeller fold protein YncE
MRLSLVCALCVLAWPATVLAIPPRAQASAVPPQALVNATVSFDGSASTDPDQGPMPLTFAWDFGDGATATGVTAQHAYAASGAYTATLTLSDGLEQSLQSLQVVVLAPVTASRAVHSSAMAVALDGAALFTANADHGSVTRVELPAMTAQTPWPVCPTPRGVAVSRDGTTVAVACEGANTLTLLSATDGTVLTRVPVCHMPYGVLAHPDGSYWVACPGDGAVQVVPADGVGAVTSLQLGGTPRALAASHDGARVWVSHFLTRGSTGTVTVLDGVGRTVVASVDLAVDPGPDTPSSGGGYPNLLGVLAVDPSASNVWVGGLKSNTGRGRFNSGVDLVPSNRVRGVALPIGLPAGTDLVAQRLDINNGDSVTGIAFTGDGRFIFLAHRGLGAVSVFDLPVVAGHDASDGSPPLLEVRFDVGEAPEALHVEGTRLYVWDELGHNVAAWDVTNPRQPVFSARVDVAPEVLPANVALGRKLFNSSRPPRLSQDGYIACASCHPGAGHDGRTWDFTQSGEGLRNTMDLRGHGRSPLGLLHWTANFDEVQDFENDIVFSFGGTGLAQDGAGPNPGLGTQNAGRSAELDALAAYVESLVTPPPSPFRAPDGFLTPAAQRGRTLFLDPVVGCANCHPQPNFTDSGRNAGGNIRLHDINTALPSSGQRLGEMLRGLDTPTLLGVWATPPYLHDGRIDTLANVFLLLNQDNWHGRTSDLAPGELDDLVAYMLSLDGRPEDPPVVTDGGVEDGGGSDGGEPDSGGLVPDAAVVVDASAALDAAVVDAAAPRDASVAVDAGRDAAVPAVDAAVAHDAAGAGADGGTGTPPRRCDCARGAHVPVGWAAWLGLMVVVLRARRRT